jgi:molybdate transport system substrate-binding protein
MRVVRLVVLTSLILALSCTQKSRELNLVVAASVGPAAQSLAELLAKQGLKVRVHSGASSLIARQIANGLDCDVVVTADNDWMDFLAGKDAIETTTRKAFLANEIVWVVRKGVQPKEDQKIAIANPDHVPAGKYAKAALLSLGLWEQLSKKMVAAPDVRTALMWLENGEVDSAIVYESDAVTSTRVVIRQRLSSIKPVIFPIAQCRSKSGRELYKALHAPEARAIFNKFGFRTPPYEQS